MKRIMKTLLVTLCIASAQINAATVSPFDGLMLSSTDPLFTQKEATGLPDQAGTTRDYRHIISNRTAAIAPSVDLLSQFITMNDSVKNQNEYCKNLVKGTAQTPNHSIKLDYASGFSSTINANSLTRLFDDNAVILGAYNPTNFISIVKFDIIQRILRVFFSRVALLASTYSGSFDGSLIANAEQTAFTSSDPLSELYNHILGQVDKDSTIPDKTGAKRYIVASGLLLKTDFLSSRTPKAAAPTSHARKTAPTKETYSAWRALPLAAAVGAYWYLSRQMGALDTDTYHLAGSPEEIVLVSAVSGGVGLAVKKIKEMLFG
jgi:hypothetical protein